jgi:hypothetical protein
LIVLCDTVTTFHFLVVAKRVRACVRACVRVCVLGDVNKIITFSTGRIVQSPADESRKPAIATAPCVPEGYL